MSPKHPWLSAFWQATLRGSAIAIAVVLLFFLMTSLTVNYVPAIDIVAFLTLVMFSLVISYSREIFRVRSLSTPFKWLLNFLINAFAFFLVLLITTRAFLMGLIIYTVLYGLIVALSFAVRRLFHKEERVPQKEQETYTSRFS